MRVYAPPEVGHGLVGADLLYVEALPGGDLLVTGRASPGTTFGAVEIGVEGAFVARLAPDGDARWLRGCVSIPVAAIAHGDRVFAAFSTAHRGAPGDLSAASDDRFDEQSLTLTALSIHDGQPLWHTQHEAAGERAYVHDVHLTVTGEGELVVATALGVVDTLGEIDLGDEGSSWDVSISWWDTKDGTLRGASMVSSSVHVHVTGLVPLGERGVAMSGDSRGEVAVMGARFGEPKRNADVGFVAAMSRSGHQWTRSFPIEGGSSSMQTIATTPGGVVVGGVFVGSVDFGLGPEGKAGAAGVALFEIDASGRTRWVRAGQREDVTGRVASILPLEGGDHVAALELMPTGGASDTGRLILDGMVYPADVGTSAVFLRVRPEGRITPIERWHADTDAFFDQARPFAMARRGDDVVVTGQIRGHVTLGEDRLTQPHGSTNPCESSRPRAGVVFARSYVDPCAVDRWYQWGGVLRVLPDAASKEDSP